MRRTCLLLLSLLSCWLSRPARAQQLQGANWIFGDSVGIGFAQGAPRYLPGAPRTRPNEISACMSSPDGRLLFYGKKYPQTAQGYLTDQQFPPPIPGNGELVFMALEWPGIPRRYLYASAGRLLQVQVLEMSADGQSGRVLLDSGNAYRRVPAPSLLPGALAAFPHANGTDTWLVGHVLQGNRFLAWRLTPQGLSRSPVASDVGVTTDSALYYYPSVTYRRWVRLKAAASGQQLALIREVEGQIHLFQFDPATGQVHSPRAPFGFRNTNPLAGDTLVDGVSFSPSGQRLYVSALRLAPPSWSTMLQLDLTQPDAQLWAQRRTVVPARAADRFVHPGQLAPDGRLYFLQDSVYTVRQGVKQFTSQVSVLTCPDELAPACGLREGVLALPQGTVGWYPPVLNETLFRNAGTLQIVASNPEPCVGDTVTLTAVGGGTDAFTWTGGPQVPAGTTGAVVRFAATQAGTYEVQGTTPCGAPRTARLTLAPRPRPAVPVISYSGGTLSTTAPGPWQWLLGGVPIPGATQATYPPAQSGSYALVVGGGCPAESAPLAVVVTGVGPEAGATAGLAVWPNPAHQTVQVQAGAGGVVELLDLQGRRLRQEAASAATPVLWSLAGLAPGVYLVRAGAAVQRLLVHP